MSHRPTIAQLRASGISGLHILIFYGILQMIEENEDGRAAAAGRYLAGQFGCSERTIRQAQAKMQRIGWFRLSTKARRYTMMSRGWRLTSDAENEAQSEAANWSKKQAVFDTCEATKKAESGATGVTAVRRSSAVGVVLDVGLEKVGKRPDPPNFVHNSKPTAKARYETAVEKAPQLPNVTIHVDRLFAELSHGHKYPWSGNATAATVLGDLIFSYGAPLVMAAAERYFVRGNAWTEERAWAIDEFARQFARLLAAEGITKRAAAIKLEMTYQAQPSTPRELKAKMDVLRRLVPDGFEDYSPEEVHFCADLRRMTQGAVPAGA